MMRLLYYRFYEKSKLETLEEKHLPPRSLKIIAEAFAIKVGLAFEFWRLYVISGFLAAKCSTKNHKSVCLHVAVSFRILEAARVSVLYI